MSTHIRVLPGRLIVLPDQDLKMHRGILHLPEQRAQPARTGVVILHNPAREEDFTNKRVVFDRWSGRPFKLIRNEQVAEFVLVHETAVLAVIEKERKMTREDLIAEYTKRINDTIENSRELNDDD